LARVEILDLLLVPFLFILNKFLVLRELDLRMTLNVGLRKLMRWMPVIAKHVTTASCKLLFWCRVIAKHVTTVESILNVLHSLGYGLKMRTMREIVEIAREDVE
jgi:hypothetical protein